MHTRPIQKRVEENANRVRRSTLISKKFCSYRSRILHRECDPIRSRRCPWQKNLQGGKLKIKGRIETDGALLLLLQPYISNLSLHRRCQTQSTTWQHGRRPTKDNRLVPEKKFGKIAVLVFKLPLTVTV